MEFRPEGLAFFWPLITLFARYISSDMLLAKHHDNQSKIPAANVKVISVRLLKERKRKSLHALRSFPREYYCVSSVILCLSRFQKL